MRNYEKFEWMSDATLGRIPTGVASLLASVTMAFSLLAPAPANAAYYTVIQDTVPFQAMPLPGGGSVTTQSMQGWGYSPKEVSVTLPFPVLFYGQLYTQVNVLGIGMVTFGSTYSTTPASNGRRAIPGAAAPHNFVAVWWDEAVCSNSPGGPLNTQQVGDQFVIQWTNCRKYAGTGEFTAQLWLTKNSDEIIVHYGPITGTWTGAMGVENIDGSDGTAGPSATGTVCNPSCSTAQFPSGKRITYSGGPNLVVEAVNGEGVGYAGISMPVSARVRNVGGKAALGFTARVLVNDQPTLTSSARELAVAPGSFDANPGEVIDFDFFARLPIDLEPGSYYILVEADPFENVPQSNRTSMVGAFGPFTIGIGAPNLAVPRVEVLAPEVIRPGGTFSLGWTAANTGNDDAMSAPYSIVLSTHDLPGPSSRVLHRGVIDSLPLLSEEDVVEEVLMPEDVETGYYRIGVIFDPDQQLFEHERTNNVGVSAPVIVATETLSVLTNTLPSAEVGSPYCTRLDATGGDAIYAWSVTAGSLAPGLSLVESPAGAREAGRPFRTMVCGTPGIPGSFDFEVEVKSNGDRAERSFTLDVEISQLPPQIASLVLPIFPFDRQSEVGLRAIGGTTPYSWKLVAGTLPVGMNLGDDGVIHGAARESGTFPITLRITDARGLTDEQPTEVRVAAPGGLACMTNSLPNHVLNEEFDGKLVGAGGSGVYRWQSISTKRLASGPGDSSQELGAVSPPGLHLNALGEISGVAGQAGFFQWTVELSNISRDESAPRLTPIKCEVTLEIAADHGLTVTTTQLPAAAVESFYTSQLSASGGEGALSWTLSSRTQLPAGLSLSSDGLIEGAPTVAQLDGELSRLFSFMVEVRDGSNRRGWAPLSLLVDSQPPAPAPKERRSESGCSAGLGDPSLLLLAAGSGLALLRRRRTRR